MSAGAYGLGTGLSPPARRFSASALSSWARTDEVHAEIGTRIHAHFSDGEIIEADLLVGADGIRSTVRQQCSPDVTPRYAGYSAWRALIAGSALPADVHRELFEYMTFGLPPGEQFLGYPVAGPDNDLRPGHRRYNVVWYRPADEAAKLQWLLTDEQRGDPHDFNSAAADPARSDRRNARRRRTAGRSAIPPDRAPDPGANPAADLRSRIAAYGVWPCGNFG